MLAGWLVLAVTLAVYAGIVGAAWLRVGRQYSRAMAGSGSMRLAAVFAAIGRYWYLLLLVIAGVLLILLGR